MTTKVSAHAETLKWADLHRDVIDVSGADALSFLHSQLANDIAQMAVGDTVHSLLLEPTGHVVALVRVVRHDDDNLTIDVESGYGDIVIKRLSKFVLRSKATMTLGTKTVRAFRGEQAQQIIRGYVTTPCVSALPWWDDPHAIDVIGDAAALPVVGSQSDASAIDVTRVDAGWPQMGTDIVSGDIPATTGVISLAVSFHKGCYPGQELVERMDSRSTMAPIVLSVFPIADDVSDDDVTSRGERYKFARIKRSDVRGNDLSSVWR